ACAGDHRAPAIDRPARRADRDRSRCSRLRGNAIWLGIMAPAGTPKPIVDRLNAEIGAILARPDLRQAWAKQGADAMPMTIAEFEAFLHRDIEKWANVVKISGAKVE